MKHKLCIVACLCFVCLMMYAAAQDSLENASPPNFSLPEGSYDKVLRGGYNDSWRHHSESQRRRAIYVRDQVVRDLHLDMGCVASHGDFVELYLNGKYWGLYNICERIDAKFLESYFKHADWDLIKDGNEVKEGDRVAWNKFRNWYTAKKRGVPDAKWIFLAWDLEYAFGAGMQPFRVNHNTFVHASQRGGGSLAVLFSKLLKNANYRRYFVRRLDEYQKSVLNPAHVQARLSTRLEQVRPAMAAEAKRWQPKRGTKDWERAAKQAQRFIARRTAHVRRHINDRIER